MPGNRQLAYLYAQARELDIAPDELDTLCVDRYGTIPAQLTRKQFRAFEMEFYELYRGEPE